MLFNQIIKNKRFLKNKKCVYSFLITYFFSIVNFCSGCSPRKHKTVILKENLITNAQILLVLIKQYFIVFYYLLYTLCICISFNYFNFKN